MINNTLTAQGMWTYTCEYVCDRCTNTTSNFASVRTYTFFSLDLPSLQRETTVNCLNCRIYAVSEEREGRHALGHDIHQRYNSPHISV